MRVAPSVTARRAAGRRFVVAVACALLTLPLQAQTQLQPPPQQPGPVGNLVVSWRVSSQGSAGIQGGGVSQGGVTVDSRGGMRAQGRVHAGQRSIQTHSDSVQTVQVLNGGEARLFMGRTVAYTAWQFAWRGPAEADGAPQAWVASQTQWLDLGQGLTVRPRWPGGRAPVTVVLHAVGREAASAGGLPAPGGQLEPDGQVRRTDVSSTLQVPLGEWTVVARRGQDGTARQTGTWSTHDTGTASDEVLEIRVSLP